MGLQPSHHTQNMSFQSMNTCQHYGTRTTYRQGIVWLYDQTAQQQACRWPLVHHMMDVEPYPTMART